MNTISNIPYISDSFFEHEKRVWRNTWLLAGREADLNEKGKFITFDLRAINVSIVILRQGSGKLIEFLDRFPVNDVPEQFKPLAYMALAACEVDDPMNIWESPELMYISNSKNWRVKKSFYDYNSEFT